jgi:nitroimidazol reductase NimA-like FMN-containing flavoprotein (pyridoxamine 5'-phosphate oxidase superfamily)
VSAAGRPAELFQLPEATCIALLGVQTVGRLIIPGTDPYVVPVNYTMTDGSIVFRTHRRPIVATLDGRKVVFEVDMFDTRSRSGWSVVVRGVARDVSSDFDAVGNEMSGAVARPWAPGTRELVISIAIDDATGRLLRGEVTPTSGGDEGYL